MIKFFHVSKEYEGGFRALDALSFFIDQGEFVFLIGASGAGKTTLLKHIYMEERPTTGQVLVREFDSRTMRRSKLPHLRRKLGIVFQDFRLLHDRDVFENVAFALRVTGERERDVKRKVFKVLAHTGLSHKCSNYPNQLSGGEQQRVSIARAIVNEPWVLLADEPTGNLDQTVSQEIFGLLQKINSWGTTVIMATHDMSLIAPYHYRVMELSRGTLVRGADNTVKSRFVCGEPAIARPGADGI
jgi:cell division transport system ATP-binding protein